MQALLTLLALLIVVHLADAANDAAKAGLRELLAHSDPHTDTFTLMSKPEQQAWGQHTSPGRSIKAWKDAFTGLRVQLSVNVVLLGFQGMGNGELEVQEGVLNRYLRAIKAELPSVVLQPEPEKLAVRPKVEFHVKHATEPLRLKVDAALKQAAVVAESSRKKSSNTYDHDGALSIPYHVVDDIIRVEKHEREGASYTVYLINPSALMDSYYLYTYQEPGQNREPDRRYSCAGTLWSGEDRYVWIDIAAGPTAYGPGLGHKGQVFEHTMVHASLFKKHKLTEAIVPDLAAVVWSALRHHLWPPLQHLEMSTKDNIEIVVVQMHDSLSPPPDRFNQDTVERVLKSALSGVQSVTVKERWLAFADCDVCQAAYSASLRELRSKEGQTLTIMTSKKLVLDSLAVHEALSSAVDEILADAYLRAEDPTAKNTHILPVFIFNMGKSNQQIPLLLDGTDKVAAFSDMVIGVSNDMGNYPSHFTCGFELMEPLAGEVTREVLGALLTSGWAIPDTSVFYNPASGAGRSYLWSVGNTPFGPLSHKISLSGTTKESAHRNLAIASLNQSVTRLVLLLQGLDQMSSSGKIDRISVPGHQADILQRLDLSLYKTEESMRLIGHSSSAAAHVYLRSLAHDVRALELLARKLDKHVAASLICQGTTSLWSLWWAPAGAVAVWPMAFALRRRIIMPKLQKLY